ncbi:MAG: hypothetical protein HQ536_04970 [Parcubacteria group bacterium]|nr:hypothetical protein [Parcubacteria group bacterium]
MKRQTKRDLELMFKVLPIILILAWAIISLIHKTPKMIKGVETKISGKIKERINEEVNKARSEEESKSSERNNY